MELKAYAKYTVTDDSVRFPIPFDYLSPKYVKVMVEDEPLQYIIDYSVEKREIVLNVPPKKDSVLVVYRETPTSRIVTWNDGSILKASDMTIQEIQMLHILEEQSDFNVLGTIRETETGEWNAKGKRIVNVADPIDPQDVITKQYIEDSEKGFISRVNGTVEEAITNINGKVESSVSSIETTVNEGVAEITVLVEKAHEDVTQKVAEAVTTIDNKVNENVTLIQTETSTAEQNIKQYADEAVEIIKNADVIITGQISEATNAADRAKADADRAEKIANEFDTTNYYQKAETDGLLASKANKQDIPKTLPANGGNADTVDGKHATDFAPSGFGLGGEVTLVTSGSANSIVDTGFYNVTPDVTDLPKTRCYYYMIVMRHKSVNPTADTSRCTKQVAYSLQPAKDGTNIYERTQYEGVWTSWKQVATTESPTLNNLTVTGTVTIPGGSISIV